MGRAYICEVDPDRDTDLLRQESTASDRKLIEVYRDTINQNDGHDLHGGVDNNALVYVLYGRLLSYMHPMYSTPDSKV